MDSMGRTQGTRDLPPIVTDLTGGSDGTAHMEEDEPSRGRVTVRWYPEEASGDEVSAESEDRLAGGRPPVVEWLRRFAERSDQAVLALGRAGLRAWDAAQGAARTFSAGVTSWSETVTPRLPRLPTLPVRERIRSPRSEEPERPARPRARRGRGEAEGPAQLPPPEMRLQEIALDAFRARQLREQARQGEARRRQRMLEAAALRQLLSQRLGIQVEPVSGRIEVDGVCFAVLQDPETHVFDLVVVGVCPGCGAPVASGGIRDLADLGWALEEMRLQRNRCDECRAGAPEEAATVPLPAPTPNPDGQLAPSGSGRSRTGD